MRYVGSWRNGRRHGRGLLTARNGDTYDGAWAAGERHGRGVLTLDRGRQRILAGWRRDKRHGPAVISVCACFDATPNPADQHDHHAISPALCRSYGHMTAGHYKQGHRHGLFVTRYANGDVAEQMFDHGLHNGTTRYEVSPGCADERFRGRVIDSAAWTHAVVIRPDDRSNYILSHPDPATAPAAFRFYYDYHKAGLLPVEERDRADVSARLERAASMLRRDPASAGAGQRGAK
jgi:hypothetical protein